jgi:hypothetical protein
MNKLIVGSALGASLGVFDGLSALVSAPEVAPQIVGIVIGSTMKGIITGVLMGFFAKKVRSVPLGVLGGLAVGGFLAFLVARMNGYYWQIILPGSALGIIVGYATQRYGDLTRKKGAPDGAASTV